MSLQLISNEKTQREKEIQDQINKKIDNNECMFFDSGAGAGKTYALTESLRYVIKKYGKHLSEHGQQIICITYTNVATDELKERLGHSDLVLISTIHERLWDLIKKHQDQLVEIHMNKMQEEVIIMDNDINSEKFQKFNELKDEEKADFINLMNHLKSEFYRCYELRSADYKKEFGSQMTRFYPLLHNLETFKRLVSTIYKMEGYKEAITKIGEGDTKYRNVQYTTRVNNDRLAKMQISHNTLLEYGNKMFEKYPILRQIVIDKYPYIFIDEYQDTNPLIVSIMNLLTQTAHEIDHPLFVGYYGDSAQNIYNDGVGNLLLQIHPVLTPVFKEFNRRSSSEVIDVINRIRADEIIQTSIYEDSKCGNVEFFTGPKDLIPTMLEKCKADWFIDGENKLNCLVLTNKVVAEQTGLTNLYNVVKRMPRYSIGKGYDLINTELLSNDLSKLGYAQRAIYEFVDFFVCVNNPQTPICDVFPEKVLRRMNISHLREILSIVRSIESEKFGEYIDKLIKIHDEFVLESYKEVISFLFPDEIVSKESLIDVIISSWSKINTDEELEKMQLLISELFELPMEELLSWHKLIRNNQDGEINYYTYHGTKGLEFDNVLILMEKRFGKDSNYFGNFFENYQMREKLTRKDKNRYDNVRNLLYVSCSRAIKNLRILFFDDINGIQSSIEEIFGEVIPLINAV